MQPPQRRANDQTAKPKAGSLLFGSDCDNDIDTDTGQYAGTDTGKHAGTDTGQYAGTDTG